MISRRPIKSLVLLLFAVELIVAFGARGAELPSQAERQVEAQTHWAFKPLKSQKPKQGIDLFIADTLKKQKLTHSPEADRATLIRRVSFILTGLPPTPEEIDGFLADRKSRAYERMVERYLQSPRYGERLGKIWLDAAGYADSNGYFNADSDRPLAYRYRDYVIRSFNRDKPFDQFVREQIAGDELAGWKPGEPATPAIIELLEATHFMRNGQDGSGESDGNPDEVRADRYYALESQMQTMGSSLLGMTFQCAKCHDHKFEPITQKDYFAFQAFLYPAFNIEKWRNPNDRVAQANLPGELEAWTASEKKFDDQEAALKNELAAWTKANRPAGQGIFRDSFDGASLTERWSNTAPGDDAPGGNPPVKLDSDTAPGARAAGGVLQIIESGPSQDRWLSTKQSFAWKPAAKGEWIQATFDLVSRRVSDQDKPAERVGYFIATRDFDHSGKVAGGNILIDGNPGGATSVQLGYPNGGAKVVGDFSAHYSEGHNFGVRVTKTDDDKFELEHLVDGAIDGKAIVFKGADLPDGGFGFEYCCGRSFTVDNVVIESSNGADPAWAKANEIFSKDWAARKKSLEKETKKIAAQRTPKPGRIAWTTDANAEPPEVRLLKRGNHKTPGEIVEPAFPVFFKSGEVKAAATKTTTGRRQAWAHWLTETNSPQSALLARVTVNRLWQSCFGVGLVSTPDNLGLSGARPSHPELLEWLAADFTQNGWSQKATLRRILLSKTSRQSSLPNPRGMAADPSNHALWRFPIQRLDAESIRDAMLASAGKLSPKTDGPYVPTTRTGEGEVVVDEAKPDGLARAIFLQHRRTQVPTFLASFDAPSVVFNCTRRGVTTMPLQSLSLLNSEFSTQRGEDLAARLKRDCGADETKRIERAFVLATGRKPEAEERSLAAKFVADQKKFYADKPDADERAWADFAQSLFASNQFLYIQ
jgi:hypothetical protein